ncbi:MAG: 4Fe-4S dicluster domain-containing protein [bacterium]
MKQARIAIRASVLTLALLCAMPIAMPSWLIGGVTSVSPFLTCMALLTGAMGILLMVGLGVGITCLFVPRFFCHWICPSGTCQTVVAAISPFKAKRDWIAKVPHVGGILFLIAAGGAVVGYPLFIWLDPLSLFLSSVGALARWKAMTLATGALAIGLPSLLVLAVIAPGFWCRKLCLAGALQDLLWRVSRLVKKGKNEKDVTLERGAAFGRRAFIGLGLGAGYRMVVPRHIGKAKGEALRPPCSMPPGKFENSCARCGACVRSCPSRIITCGGVGDGLRGWLAPEVIFDEGRYCPDSCSACGQVCPTGAIGRFTKETKNRSPLGILEIDHESCRMVENGGCGFCLSECPRKALSTVFDKKLEARRVQINLSKCNGCGKCLKCCPVEVMRVVRRV